ncbi:MAG: pilus assembly PilX N-terminal domain-containing protein, partial [Candidatus Methylomirabilales bacterium]
MRAKNRSTFKGQGSTLKVQRSTLNSFRNPEAGTVLIVALLVVTFLSLLGTAFLILASTESRIAFNEKDFARALYVAEAGIERARQDLKYDTAFDKLCGLFNRYFGSPIGPNTDTGSILGSAGRRYYDLGTTVSACDQKIPANGFLDVYTNSSPVSADTYSDGATYSVKLGNASGIEVTARSQGQIGTRASRTIEARFRVVNFSPWNNAAFAGTGASGATINGNAIIAGSLHLLGDTLSPADKAVAFSGGGGIFNRYKDIDSTAYAGKLPNVAPTTLNTEVRVKQGKISLDGTAMIGESTHKVDGVYTNNGFTGNQDPNFLVYSKNGKETQYDVPLDVTVPFPCLRCTNPETGLTYQQELDNNAYTYSGDLTIDANTESFLIGSGSNILRWNKEAKTLT